MQNVEKELYDLIAQYKADPNKNINPFSMRLQGIIDANVMGGISKYQEAFFTEQFAKSADGKGQQANVHKLKCLILEQVLILETALALHGQLAPVDVQPLHKRLLERFSQLKQSLSGLEKLKRPHSDSIVNTPLPPLPIEKRTVSLENSHGIYEQDDIYTRPMEHNKCASDQPTFSRDGLLPLDIKKEYQPAPPIPNRPRSTCYSQNGSTESPEIPPKVTKAPPLPPRGYTPDKRLSNPMSFSDFDQTATAPNIPRRTPKYSVVNISLDDEVEADHHLQYVSSSEICIPPNDFCDTDLIDSNDLNNPNKCIVAANTRNHKTNSNPEMLNIHNEITSSFPPPIPPKSIVPPNFVATDDECVDRSSPNDGGGGAGDGYCVPKEIVKDSDKKGLIN